MKTIYKVVLTIIVLLIAVCTTALVSYAFIGGATNSAPTNVTANIQKSNINMTYAVTPLSIYIDRDLLPVTKASNDYSSYIESDEASIVMTLTFPTSVDKGVKCFYDIIYTPIVQYQKSPGAGALHELTIFGSNGLDTISEIAIDNMTSPITIATDKVFSSSISGDTMIWNFKMRFYNLEVEQTSALLQSPSGTLSILTKTCGGL